MTLTSLTITALAGIGVALGLRWWRPAWYWLAFGAVIAVVRVLRRFRETMEGCNLVIQPAEWRVAVAYASRSGLPPARPPRLVWLRPTRTGLRLWLKLRPGQSVTDFQEAAGRLRHAFEMHGVSAREVRPGVVQLRCTGYDVLRRVQMPRDVERALLRIPVALREDGSVYYRDFRAAPHGLIVGASDSGKSTLQRRMIAELARQEVALVGIDCKRVELAPLARRFSAMAEDADTAAGLLEALVERMASVYEVIRREQRISADTPDEAITSDIWGLPDYLRPVPIVLFIDEVAELLLATKADKARRERIITALVRLVQLGRAAGIYVEICGQRLGADLGDGVTLLRAQLTNRISHRVNEESSARMTFGDIADDALSAVLRIRPNRRGTAVAGDTSGRWRVIRAPYTSLRRAVNVCNLYADLTPDLPELALYRPLLLPRPRLVEPTDVLLGREHIA
ncbi:FtsK/SpoIIIE domain-containing protein [Streptomyces sp. NPDC051940]|uniref:FtsK/SpoIIIE domain-containing protein n=1 Tax=Streptomyces sp. NPDC051940 TaxID=3155675 RepID=UPI00343EC06A